MKSLMNKDSCRAENAQFDLDWDDNHVMPKVICPDLAFLFRRINDVAVSQVAAGKGERILDIGCGRAIDAVELAKGEGECLGIEPSEKMMSHAKNYIGQRNAEVILIRGIGECLPFKDASFDKVMCKGALDHFPYPDRAVAEIARVLKPQGKAIIAVANFESLSFKLGRRLFKVMETMHKEGLDDKRVWHVPEDHYYKFDYASLRKIVEPHLKVERYLGISMFFGFPWWGMLLGKMPSSISLITLNTLDKLARRLPSLSDTLLLKGSPRHRA